MAGSGPFDSAVRLLARRDHTVAEISRKLRVKGFDNGEIENAVARLQDCGYLNDRRFAERWSAEAMRQGRAVGRRLFLELCRRGVSRDIAEELLSSSEGDYDERAAVRELLARRYPSFDPASADSRERRRIVSWFQRRGFSLSAIFDSLRMTEDE